MRSTDRVIDLFSPEGIAALDELARRRTLYAFDFDGTLAPIVAEPDAAHAAPSTEALLADLAGLVPTAVVTGRGIDDLRSRLGVTATYVVGNHGAEGLPGPQPDLEAHRAVIAGWLAQWRASGAQSAGVVVEPKAYSLSIHYRQAPDHDAAMRSIRGAFEAFDPQPRVIGGKCVFNLLPEGAPDKGSALVALVAESRCEIAFFVGDDLTDEVAFASAPPSWFTVRVGNVADSAARFFIDDQSAIDRCLALLVERARSRR
jgi:trehalose 6-phosphate phosphatase